jgi:hypothetical protein
MIPAPNTSDIVDSDEWVDIAPELRNHEDIAIKQRGEVFTPTTLVNEMLDKLPPSLFSNHNKTFLDNSCGNGQFLIEVLRRKMANGMSHLDALFTIYGIEIDEANAEECRVRLLMGRDDPLLRAVVNRNIICGDALNKDVKRFNWKHVGYYWHKAISLEDLRKLSADELMRYKPPTQEEWDSRPGVNPEAMQKLFE